MTSENFYGSEARHNLRCWVWVGRYGQCATYFSKVIFSCIQLLQNWLLRKTAAVLVGYEWAGVGDVRQISQQLAFPVCNYYRADIFEDNVNSFRRVWMGRCERWPGKFLKSDLFLYTITTYVTFEIFFNNLRVGSEWAGHCQCCMGTRAYSEAYRWGIAQLLNPQPKPIAQY